MIETANWVGQPLSGGRYKVVARLGEGGMALVYRAREPNLDRDVVIKVPRPAMLEDPEFVARFSREVRALVRLEHPAIVKIIDFGEHKGAPFVVLQYLPGGSLRDRQRAQPGGRAPVASLRGWVEKVAQALDFIHGQGYVHRDVKPDNVLFDALGHPFLSDFGIAKALDDRQGAAGRPVTVATATGVVVGTPQYMAPELVLGKPYDGRVDQYALAATVFEVIGGRPPFDGNTPAAIALEQARQAAPPVKALLPDAPREVVEALKRALSVDPARRFPNCLGFARALLGAPVAVAVPAPALLPVPPAEPAAPAAPPARASETVCPHCGRRSPLPAGGAGKRVMCPGCKGTFRAAPVLTPDGKTAPLAAGTVREQPVTVPVVQPVAHRPARAPAASNGRLWLLLGIGAALLVFLPALVVGGYYLFRGNSRGASAARPTLGAVARVELLAGESATLPVSVTRNGNGDALTFKVEGLPDGVSARLPTLAGPDSSAKLEMIATTEAPRGDHTATLSLWNGSDRFGQQSFTVHVDHELTNSLGMKLVRVPRGRFRMGSPAGEGGDDDERPQHDVEITRGFYLAEHTVTFGQFRRFVEDGSYRTDAEADGKGGTGYDDAQDKAKDKDGRRITSERSPRFNWKEVGWPQTDRHPVVNVTWNDAQRFCEWLSKKEKRAYRLPTEAEWEYACRAGTATRFWCGEGDASLDGAANLADRSYDRKVSAKIEYQEWDDGQPFTAPVGSYRANPWGLYDMHGNVFQWCQDWVDSTYYRSSPGQDPQGPATGTNRIIRGGAFSFPAKKCRSAYRLWGAPDDRNCWVGFRVVLVPGGRAAAGGARGE
jgi:formylglycine-generating enzyme required for sulfatase activity/tRNA A-37 threonylcarbamoyl transferase component Bud32